jgi:hypothetical protein
MPSRRSPSSNSESGPAPVVATRTDRSSGAASGSSARRSKMCVPIVMKQVPPYSAIARVTGSGLQGAHGRIRAPWSRGM